MLCRLEKRKQNRLLEQYEYASLLEPNNSMVMKSLTSYYRRVGDFEKSTDYLNRSIVLSKKLDNNIGIAIAYHIFSHNYHQRGDLNKAFEYALRSHKILEEVDSFCWAIFCPLFDLGRFNFDKKKYDKERDILVNMFISRILITRRF